MSSDLDLSPSHARPGARGVAAALFASRTQAQGAIQDLQGAGFDTAKIGLALRDRDAQDQLLAETGTQAAGGAGVGAAGGGIVGGLAGLLIGMGALVIPGLGPVIAGGALASALGVAGGTALAGAGIGAATGGIVGALVGAGLPETEAKRLHAGFAGGGVLVTVDAGQDRLTEAEGILRNAGGDLGREGDTGASAAVPRADETGFDEVPATPAAQVEGAEHAAPPLVRPTSDDPADDVAARRPRDEDTGSRMTI